MIGRMTESDFLLSYRLQEDFGGDSPENANLVIPGILKCADVADIAAMIAPRALEIHEFVAAKGEQVSADEISTAFKRCADIYDLLGSAISLRLSS